MNIYPAIDLYHGKVVRLSRGDFQKETVYSENPAAVATEWEKQGARWLHVVDLQGAKTGELLNHDSLVNIRMAVKCRIQYGGGLRSLTDIKTVLDEGIDRVVLGTKALDKPFLAKALAQFGSKIAVGLDVRGGFVQTEGWLKASETTFESALDYLNRFQIETIIYTDIQKDGMLQGADFSGLSDVLEHTHARVILSGGVSDINDIMLSSQVAYDNFEGIIVGKALYDKKFTLSEAVAALSKSKG